MTDKDGVFQFAANLTEPGFYRFKGDGNRNALILLLTPNDNAVVTVSDTADWQKNYTVTGSAGSSLLHSLSIHYNRSLAALEQIRENYNLQVKDVSPTSDQYKAITEQAAQQYDSVVSTEREFLKTFVSENNSSLASISALYQTFDFRTRRPILLDNEDGLKYFEMVDTVLMNKYAQLNDVQAFHKNYLQIKSGMQRQQATIEAQNANTFTIGDEVPDISLPSPDGSVLSLASLRGKVVLLDFWASWCAPCRAESPVIVAAYNTYHSKGFEIFQVSLDKSKQAWTDAIKKDGLVWKYHVSDLQFWNSSAAKLYGVESIPANYLLNKEGKVIAKNLRGEELSAVLEELL